MIRITVSPPNKLTEHASIFTEFTDASNATDSALLASVNSVKIEACSVNLFGGETVIRII